MNEFFRRDWTAIGCLIAIALIAGLLILEGWIAAFLWNWIAPIFWSSAPVLTTWQALGIMFVLDIIGTLLFKSSSKISNE